MEKNRYSGKSKKYQNKRRWAFRSRKNSGIPKESKNGTVGYVYVFNIHYNSLYKVGMAGNWQTRLRDLKASNPNVEMVLAIRVGNARDCEKHLHHHFRKVHVERELFRLTKEHIDYAEKFLNENAPRSAEPLLIPKAEPNPYLRGWLSRRKEDIQESSAN